MQTLRTAPIRQAIDAQSRTLADFVNNYQHHGDNYEAALIEANLKLIEAIELLQVAESLR